MTERAITEGASGEHRGALESYRLALSMAKADYAQAIELQQQALAIGLETSGVFTIDEARLQLGRSYLAAGQLDESRSHFGAVVESAQDDHRRQVAARGLDGLAACAEASGAPEVAAALLDEALERLGAMTPLHATKLRRRREALARSA
jgi:tetratricopeptide (TPR) repeat protein